MSWRVVYFRAFCRHSTTFICLGNNPIYINISSVYFAYNWFKLQTTVRRWAFQCSTCLDSVCSIDQKFALHRGGGTDISLVLLVDGYKNPISTCIPQCPSNVCHTTQRRLDIIQGKFRLISNNLLPFEYFIGNVKASSGLGILLFHCFFQKLLSKKGSNKVSDLSSPSLFIVLAHSYSSTSYKYM